MIDASLASFHTHPENTTSLKIGRMKFFLELGLSVDDCALFDWWLNNMVAFGSFRI